MPTEDELAEMMPMNFSFANNNNNNNYKNNIITDKRAFSDDCETIWFGKIP